VEYLIRFVVGGFFVSAFAALGDVLRPRSFAGLFGAAPSIAIATLLIALLQQGPAYTAVEARSMIIGSSALLVYSLISCQLMKRFELSGLLSTILASGAWLGCAFALNWMSTGMF
jgi:hypothetical protein